MSSERIPRRKRAYHAPRREAAAAQRRDTIVDAAKRAFEEHGWSGTTIAAVAESAEVSPKTIEALFGTKAALLRAAVEYAIRGDTDPLPMPRRSPIREMEAAVDAATMLRLHAAHLRSVNGRSAQIAWVVEHAAAGDSSAAELWEEMNHNRAYAVRWATKTLRRKPGRKAALSVAETSAIFWVAIDWGTFRTLTQHAGLTDGAFERWLRRYYETTLLENAVTR